MKKYLQIEIERGNRIFSLEHENLFKSVGEIVSLKKDDILCRSGEVLECHCYYVITGTLVGYTISFSGAEVINAFYGPKSICFLPSMFIRHEMYNNFKAAVPSTVIRISKNDLYRLIETYPSICSVMFYNLSFQLIEAKRLHRERGNFPVSWRVCKKLLDLAISGHEVKDGKIVINAKLSQQIIANFVQANRVTVNKVLVGLKELDLIEIVNGFYCIKDVEKLRQHMEMIS
jgi:CRP/FNR family transcriptional regulator